MHTILLPLASSCGGAWLRGAEATENPIPPPAMRLAGVHRLHLGLLDLHGSGGRGEKGGHNVHAHFTNAQEGLHILFMKMNLKWNTDFMVK